MYAFKEIQKRLKQNKQKASPGRECFSTREIQDKPRTITVVEIPENYNVVKLPSGKIAVGQDYITVFDRNEESILHPLTPLFELNECQEVFIREDNVVATLNGRRYMVKAGVGMSHKFEVLFGYDIPDTILSSNVYVIDDHGDYVIKIDHHIPVEDFGNYQYVDTTRPAASQIILEFYLKFKDELKFNMNAAKALYTGIVTDTGRFKYRSVSADTFRAVAFLLEYGLDFTEILGKLDIKSERLMKLQGYVLQNFEKTPDGVAYIKMKPEIIKKFGTTLEEATSLVNELSTLEDCPVWMLFAEYENNVVRGRLRSRKPAIDKLANKYNGGGHKLACGANLGDWETVDRLLEDANELVREYKRSMK